MAEIRRRNVYRSVDLNNSGNNVDDAVEDAHGWEPVFRFSPLSGFVLLLIWSSTIFTIGLYFNDNLPTTDSDVLTKFDFKTDNVLQDLKILASFGPKVTGSHANEYEAVNFLHNRIVDIKTNGGSANEISYDLQKVSGKFPLTIFSKTYVVTYENIQNIVVKVGPRGMSNYSLLINCHFDSVPTSPGASDDGLNCAVMLEMIRVLSLSPKKLPHNIIFLFNGAEENPLIGSHGFITEHKWAHEIKTFINLESCGAGGKETLFQAGPNHPWLIKTYGEAAKYPNGLVIAEEIFQSGLIPSDTDFRIFRDFGHIPGLDFAHCKNGYVYHTKFDNIESIESPHGVIKHTGENILSLSKAILNSKEFINPASYQTGKQVFFDIFGLVFINYSEDFATSLNIITLFISLLGIILTISMLNSSGNILEVLVKFLMTLLSLLTFLIIAVCYNLFIAFAIDFFGYSLSWYTNTGLLILIYVIPSIFMMIINTIVVDKWIMGNIAFNAKILLSCLSIQLLWTLFLFASFFLNVRSSYMLMIIVLPNALWTLITVLQKRGNRKLWHALFILISSFSSSMICYNGITSFRLFIPITGRIGVSKNPEFIISLLAALLSVAAFSFVTTLFLHVKKQRVVLKIMLGLHLMSFLFVISPMGFPFSVETPQRIFVTHVNRQFFNSQMSTEYSDSLFWIQSMERRGWHLIPFLRDASRLDEFCEKNGYCGLPWFSKVRERTGSTCIPFASHGLKDETQLEIISKELIGKEFHLEFQISGSDHMGLIVTPSENVTLLGWNLPSQVTQTSNIASFVQGIHNSSQTIVLEALKDSSDSVITIEVYSLYFHHQQNYSSDFHKFLKKFPKWSDVVPALATYKLYLL
ncbi:unnamed protein product [Nezara viridula]|uniref:FXNA-like protease n=1 Tax=Nezara viridula TaxID=85310 RepID=A0A9P0GZK0_NEZVI|nr:unnamed protein product [Nezara viridula]